MDAFGKCFQILAGQRRAQWLGSLARSVAVALLLTGRPAEGQTTAFTYDPPGDLTNVTPAAALSPTITVQPASQIISESGTVYFSFVAAGPGQLSYQWLSNGVPIPGATGDVLAVTSVVVPTNLVSNGSFETPFIGESNVAYLTFPAGQTMGGWTVASNSVDLMDTYWEAADGVQSVDLNGSSAGGAIYQDVATTPGQQYYLSFSLAGNPGGAPAVKTNQVWWNGSLLDTETFNTTGYSVTAMGWTNLEYLVTATGTTTRIEFASVTSGGYGPAVDKVALEAAPPAPADYSVVVGNAFGSVTSVVAQAQFDVGPTNPTPFRPSLNVVAALGGQVTASPLQQSYALGDPVQITAIPDAGNLFLYWTGDLTGTNSTENLVMENDLTFSAVFGLGLVNGDRTAGTISTGGTNIYVFQANAGDSIHLRMGTTGFSGLLQLFGPDGTLLSSDNDYYDDLITYTATNSGTFTVLVSSDLADGTGSYVLNLAQMPEPFIVPPGNEGGPMTNGGNYAGTITLGDQDMWSFTANAGDSINLRLGTTGFSGLLQLFGPNGALLSSDNDYYDDLITYTATNSGTFTVLVSSDLADGTGSYVLNLAQMPEPFIVPPGDAGGPMTNGGNYAGTITLGDQDMWSFTANAGDSINLRLGTTGFNGLLQLFGPNGALLSSDSYYYDDLIAYKATNSGTFTVLVSSDLADGTGSYVLNLAQIPEPFIVPPGDEGGPMTNGGNYPGTITLGDQDMWTFTANAGDSINLRLGTTGFNGLLQLFGPNGALLSSDNYYYDDLIAYKATNSGTFTVLVSSELADGIGSYVLNLAQMPEPFIVPPGNAGGPMTNGGNYPGTITLGDQNMWSFTANAGDSINLRLGTTGFNGLLQLFGPNGALLSSDNYYFDDLIAYKATNSGTFTVLVSSAVADGTGSYVLNLAQMPEPFIVPAGDEGGPMTNGGNYPGIITLGDQDMWSFTANAGDSINLRMGTTGFYGELQLYGPNGALVSSDNYYYDDLIAYKATNSGTFTVLVSSAAADGIGSYVLNLAQIPEPFIVPSGDEGGPMTNGGNYAGAITLGDQDLWTFTANAGDSINLRMGTTGFYGELQLYGPNGALVSSDNYYYDDLIAYKATNSGTFTVLVSSAAADGTGSYAVNLAQIPEPFIVPSGDEGGPMTNGDVYPGTITLGDQDMWSFTACTGDLINLGLRTTNFNGELQLYGSNGALLETVGNNTSLSIAYTATNCGTFTVLVSSYISGGIGTYQLSGNGLTDGLKLLSPAVSGTNLYLFGSGGGSNLLFVIYATTNLAQPAGLWTPILTNRFDASGVFNITNRYDPGQPQQYFRFSVP